MCLSSIAAKQHAKLQSEMDILTHSLIGSGLHEIDGLVQDCNISIANALEILQSCTKPSILDIGMDTWA